MDTNHILLPTTYFEVQNLIMNVSLNIQMNTTHNKHKMKLVKKNELSLNNYQNNSIFIGNNPNISYHIIFLSSSYLNVKTPAFWSIRRFGCFKITFSPLYPQYISNFCLLQYILLDIYYFTAWRHVITLSKGVNDANKAVNSGIRKYPE